MLRLRAPELTGRSWLNTGGETLSLPGLRGRIVILDFWTFCCINCLHVIDELRPLEAKYGDSLVVIGVHSPKFEHEANSDALAAAVERYDVHHPVLDDPELSTWQQYAVRAWPTLVVIDPEGYIVAQLSGEGHGHALDRLLEELVDSHSTRGTLHRGTGVYVPPKVKPSTLRFPSKTILLPNGNLLVTDTGHHSLAELAGDGQTLVRRIGSGSRGLVNGSATVAQFNEPNGLCLLPDDIRKQVGFDVVVADTVNHSLRGVRLSDGRVRTLAGTGTQWMQGDPFPDRSFPDMPLSSPWDVAWFPAWREVAIAMAGNHQVWSFDPVTSRLTLRAGTTSEGLIDGDATSAWFAQTSGLAPSTDGITLWLVDSETSSLRRIRNGVVHTEIGTGLFDFGLVDGDASQAMLQHPLGVAVLPDRSVVIADTYNGAIRRFDPSTREVSTLATGLAEPSGVVARGDSLIVTESNAHRLVRVRVPKEALRMTGERMQTQRPPLDVRPGTFELAVNFVAPAGQKLDDRYGPATHLAVSATPPALLAEGSGTGSELNRQLVLSDDVADGVLHVSVRAASCDSEGVEFPACHVHQQDWGVPLHIDDSGVNSLELSLAQRSDDTTP
ncbi:MAG TPA: NHL domain-containing thioredoxin family protein [Actinomycetes bacterium]|nr:NHL domain-containing thioredoxin family protein [Actinomycetes bacterium]